MGRVCRATASLRLLLVALPARMRQASLILIALAAATGTLHAADCNGNGIEDSLDILLGAATDANGDGVPDQCEADASDLPTFGTHDSTTVRIGSSLNDLVLADFDDDSRLDLVTAHGVAPGLRVHFGRGEGAFSEPVEIIGEAVARVAAADMDGDRVPDIVSTAGIILSTGGRTFGNPFGEIPTEFELGDVDGNGTVDVVTAEVVLRNRGAGDLQSAPRDVRPELAEIEPAAIPDVRLKGLADLDGDNDLDMLLSVLACLQKDDSCISSAFFAENNGRGEFSTGSMVCDRCLEVPIVTEVTGDGSPDVVDLDVLGVGVYVNEGAGFFQDVLQYRFAEGVFLGLEFDWSRGVVTGDFDGDGFRDLALTHTVGTSRGEQGLLLLWNRGRDGGFSEDNISMGMGVALPRAADLDGDGDLDLFVPDLLLDRATILWNKGRRRFSQPPRDFSTTGGTHFIAVGDLNGDGAPDVVTPGAPGGVPQFLNAFFNNGEGDLGVAIPNRRIGRAGVEPAAGAVLADLDADGDVDVAALQSTGSAFQVLLNEPLEEGTLFARESRLDLGGGQVAITAALMNADDALDVVTAFGGTPGDVGVHRYDEGAFRSHGRFPLDAEPIAIAAGDLDGDGTVDIAAVTRAGLALLTNDGEGRLSAPSSVNTDGTDATSLLINDFDGDAQLDIVIAGTGFPSLSVLFNSGAAEFESRASLVPDGDLRSVAAADLDNDGDMDIAVADARNEAAAVFWNEGGRAFSDPVLFPVERLPLGIIAVDLNGDDAVDLATANGVSISVLLNDSGLGGPEFRRGDCDGDGQTATLNDAIALLNFNFLGQAEPPCLAACDSDGDGAVRGSVGDTVYLLNFAFVGLAAPPPPFPDCGPGDELDEETGCEIPTAGCE